MSARKRGGQPGNTNAVTHGRFRRAAREARLQAIREEVAADRAKFRAWEATQPKTDYRAIAAALKAEKRRREVE